jgi:hypothetical protein
MLLPLQLPSLLPTTTEEEAATAAAEEASAGRAVVVQCIGSEGGGGYFSIVGKGEGEGSDKSGDVGPCSDVYFSDSCYSNSDRDGSYGNSNGGSGIDGKSNGGNGDKYGGSGCNGNSNGGDVC